MRDIRTMCYADIVAIGAHDGGPAWHKDAARWTQYWAQNCEGLRLTLVATLQGAVVGYGSLLWQSQHTPFARKTIPEIQDMVVAENHRGQGIASTIMADLEQLARSAGKPIIGLGVGLYADYGAAQQLYARRGYMPDGTGVTYANQTVIPGNMVKLDDDLVLWLTKNLA